MTSSSTTLRSFALSHAGVAFMDIGRRTRVPGEGRPRLHDRQVGLDRFRGVDVPAFALCLTALQDTEVFN